MLISLLTPSLEGVSQRSQYHGAILVQDTYTVPRGVTSGRYWLCQFCHCLLLSWAQWERSLVLLILPTNVGWRAESTLEGFEPVTFRPPCEDATDYATPTPLHKSECLYSTKTQPHLRLGFALGTAPTRDVRIADANMLVSKKPRGPNANCPRANASQ